MSDVTDIDVVTEVPDTADHRPDVYREDGVWVFRASSFGNCDANLVRQALGQTPLPPPDNILKAYGEGVKYEDVILKGLGEYGWKMMDARECGDYGRVDETGQLLCELQVGPNAVIRCHPDGIVQCWRAATDAKPDYGVGSRRVAEAKALKAGAWSRPLEKRQYGWQMSIEMACTGLRGCFVVGWKHPRKDGGEGVEVRPEHVDPMWVDTAPFGLGAIKARARKLVKLFDAAEKGDGPPACDWAMWPCGFYPSHDKEEPSVWWRGPEHSLEDEAERHAKSWVFQWRKAKGMVDKWKVKEEEARTELMGILVNQKVGKWNGGDVEVTYVEPSTYQRFDPKLAKFHGIDLAPAMVEREMKGHVRIKDLDKKTVKEQEGL